MIRKKPSCCVRGREFHEEHAEVCGSCPGGSRGLRRADTSQTFFAVNIYMYSRCSYGIKAKRASLPRGQAWPGPRAGDTGTALHCLHRCLHARPSPHTCTSAVAPRTRTSPRMPTWCERAGSRPGCPGEGEGGGGMAQVGWGNSLLLLVRAPKVVWGGRAVLGGLAPRTGSAELPVHGFGAELVAE